MPTYVDHRVHGVVESNGPIDRSTRSGGEVIHGRLDRIAGGLETIDFRHNSDQFALGLVWCRAGCGGEKSVMEQIADGLALLPAYCGHQFPFRRLHTADFPPKLHDFRRVCARFDSTVEAIASGTIVPDLSPKDREPLVPRPTSYGEPHRH